MAEWEREEEGKIGKAMGGTEGVRESRRGKKVSKLLLNQVPLEP